MFGDSKHSVLPPFPPTDMQDHEYTLPSIRTLALCTVYRCTQFQAWKAGGKGGTEIGFGASVYPAAFVLADFLERHPYLVRGKRVIELGEPFT